MDTKTRKDYLTLVNQRLSEMAKDKRVSYLRGALTVPGDVKIRERLEELLKEYREQQPEIEQRHDSMVSVTEQNETKNLSKNTIKRKGAVKNVHRSRKNGNSALPI